MLSKLTNRISPSAGVAMIALFVALGGVSYAAGQIGTAQIKNGAVTAKKLKRDAVVTAKIKNDAVTDAKIRNDAVTGAKIRNDAVTGAKVDESTLGTVPSAATLAGQGPAAFQSKGFISQTDASPVNLPTDAVTAVGTLALPAGTYLVLARGGINNNGSQVEVGPKCTLAAGGSEQTIGFGALAENGEPSDRDEFSAQVIAHLPAPGEAVLSCDTNAAWDSGNMTDPSIAAVSLQP